MKRMNPSQEIDHGTAMEPFLLFIFSPQKEAMMQEMHNVTPFELVGVEERVSSW